MVVLLSSASVQNVLVCEATMYLVEVVQLHDLVRMFKERSPVYRDGVNNRATLCSDKNKRINKLKLNKISFQSISSCEAPHFTF